MFAVFSQIRGTTQVLVPPLSLALAGPGERRCARAAARQGAATAGAPGFQAAAADPAELPRRSSRPALRRRRGVEPGAPGFQELHPAPRVQLAPRLRPRCGAGPGAPGFQVPHPAPQVQRAPGHLAGRRTPAAGLPRLDAEDGASARPTPAARGLVAGVRRHTARADEGLRWLAGALQLPVGVQLWPPHLPSGSAGGRAGARRLAGRGPPASTVPPTTPSKGGRMLSSPPPRRAAAAPAAARSAAHGATRAPRRAGLPLAPPLAQPLGPRSSAHWLAELRPPAAG